MIARLVARLDEADRLAIAAGEQALARLRDGQTPAPDYLSLSTKLGAAYSLRKPFRPQELLKAVRQCMANLNSDPSLKAAG